ncbi:MAG TPA: cation:proton antiporter [Spirochaetota bacterium]|nr:cation:proton antiporter [Spirochaetota bacterium]HOM37632.1 cation:proton antiporter [Spirochaetota bacterium]HPQ49397.1 cation:proton antiporter [Spirochaetota bacterium]
MSENIFAILAFFIFFSKIISDLCYRIKIPPVIGMILIGIIIGPTGFNLIKDHNDLDKLRFFSNIGVVLLLFIAGMDTEIEMIKRVGKNSFIIALGGVILPFLMGSAIVYLFTQNTILSIVIGTILTATSVSITVMTLLNMKKINTIEGNTILSAAVIDDILGIIVLSITLSFIGGSNLTLTLVYMIIYILGAILIGIFIIPYLLDIAEKFKSEKAIISVTLSLLFIFSWAAEKTELAAITGAYIAGLFVGNTKFKSKIEEGIATIGDSIFISLFFVYIGLETHLDISHLDPIFSLLLVAIAVISKIIGNGIFAKFVGFDTPRSLIIGVGMVPRGEVALVITSVVMHKVPNLIPETYFASIVFMIMVTSIITPILITLSYKKIKEGGVHDS